MIQSKAVTAKYLGPDPMSIQNQTTIKGVSFTDAVVWTVQPAANNSFRYRGRAFVARK